ncbi:MAG: hypothetical protein IPM16_00140 [Chloroflexi bacterium]|nr:hypothetical protein [Chloroflexota bacterium]
MTQVYNTNVEVNGSDDVVQLAVTGNSVQTEPLQEWNTNSGDAVARLHQDGRVQSGSLDTGAGATGDAQIEVFRHESATALPKRGLNITGAITDALTSIVGWTVHELFLKGTAGVRALHSALRVRITNQNTGTDNANGELRAGEFEVSNAGGGSGNVVPFATGLDVRVTNEVSGHIGTAYGVHIAVSDLNTNGIGDAYTLHATGGKTRLDDVLELYGNRASAPTAEEQVAKIYVKSDGKLYAKLEGALGEYLLSAAPTPVSGDEGKYLRGDGSWQTAVGTGANTALSNLTSVAVNTSLISDTDNTDDLGTSAKKWRAAYSNALYLEERTAPPTPTSGDGIIYVKSDGLYFKDDSGTEERLGHFQARVTTVNNATTTIFDYTPATSSAVLITGYVSGVNTIDYATGLVSRFAFTVARTSGGTTSILGSFTNTSETSANTPFVLGSIVGNSFVLQVDQDAGGSQAWNWLAEYTITVI